MTDLAIRPERHAVRSWWLSIAAWLVIAWLALHVLGVVMTFNLEGRLGFFPIWFLDCVACSAPEFSIPYGAAVVGGISLSAVAGSLTAVSLLVLGKRAVVGWSFSLGLVMVTAMAFHVVVTWPARYPGSLPPVAVAVVPPLGAALAGALGLFGVRGEANKQSVGRTRVSVWAAACFVSGVVSMVLLGSYLASVAALALCAWRLRSARPGLDRVLVIIGGVLAALSIILRVLLLVRYPSRFGWLW